MVTAIGFKPITPTSVVWYSIQLSYAAISVLRVQRQGVFLILQQFCEIILRLILCSALNLFIYRMLYSDFFLFLFVLCVVRYNIFHYTTQVKAYDESKICCLMHLCAVFVVRTLQQLNFYSKYYLLFFFAFAIAATDNYIYFCTRKEFGSLPGLFFFLFC